jgi:hypothetical protein
MLITSRTLSTTQMVSWSRERSLQIEHTSASEIILQSLQYFTSFLSLSIEAVK